MDNDKLSIFLNNMSFSFFLMAAPNNAQGDVATKAVIAKATADIDSTRADRLLVRAKLGEDRLPESKILP